jgi:hypothetical protein
MMQRTTSWTALVLALVISSTGFAASKPSLKIAPVTAKPGSTVELPVSLNAGSAAISALQFNLTLPPQVTAGTVNPTAALTGQGKSVTATVRGNVWTFIIFGPNQNIIPSGELVKVSVKIAPNAPNGSLKIAVGGTVFSDPKAQSVEPGTSSAAVIKVTPDSAAK